MKRKMSLVSHQSASAVIIAVTLISGSYPVAASGHSPWKQALPLRLQDSADLLAQPSPGIGPDAAARRAAGITGGRVLRVRRRDVNGGGFYEVKVLLPGGRVRLIRVDARTGRVQE